MNAGLSAIQRIVVTLDTSACDRPAVEIAARLAAAVGAELEGVFIEDINLIRLSELPFARQIRASSLIEEAIDPQSLQRDLQALARQAERLFLQTTQTLGVQGSFRVWRGHTTVETLCASFEADVIGLYRRGAAPGYPMEVRSRWQRPAAGPVQAVVNLLYSASPAGDRALAAACELAQDLGTGIRVLLPDTGSRSAGTESHARDMLSACPAPAALVRLPGAGAAELARAVRASGSGAVLIAATDSLVFRRAGLGRSLETLGCPVLLVR